MTKSILVAGMFDRETQVITPETQALQGLLRDGQCLVDDTFHNAGWYNREGVKVGCGDLSASQLEVLHTFLPVGEVLFILNEQSSTWGVPKNLDQYNPGVDYVAEKASAVVTPTGLFTISTKDYAEPDSESTLPDNPVERKFNTRTRTIPCHSASRAWVRFLAKLLKFLNT